MSQLLCLLLVRTYGNVNVAVLAPPIIPAAGGRKEIRWRRKDW